MSGIIEDIERAGKPVITSNQALLWHSLRTLGETIDRQDSAVCWPATSTRGIPLLTT
ncbi:hypothetical protein [Cupriavidus sp. CuC1]|uniref:hypothetical protein n=1 Tax=Cupriavidus sp. CuC1 TaxID=3373131 RepID=UPI0037CD4D68